jgi:hypothetical protein
VSRYRIYLLAADDHVQRASDLEAAGDPEALMLAGWLWDACSAIFPAYELWFVARRIFAGRGDVTAGTGIVLTDLTTKQCDILLDLADTLGTGHDSLVRSERFLACTGQLRSERARRA